MMLLLIFVFEFVGVLIVYFFVGISEEEFKFFMRVYNNEILKL